MRYAEGHKEKTRERLLDEAAGILRAKGPEGVSVASLMSRLGLTHGGFYAHFKSKDDLIRSALEKSFDEGRIRLRRALDGREAAEGLVRYIDDYLSISHVRQPELGCPLPSLSPELGRVDDDKQGRLASGAQHLREAIAKALIVHGKDDGEAVALAASTLSEMVGAIALARVSATDDEAQTLLEASKLSIKRRLGLVT